MWVTILWRVLLISLGHLRPKLSSCFWRSTCFWRDLSLRIERTHSSSFFLFRLQPSQRRHFPLPACLSKPQKKREVSWLQTILQTRTPLSTPKLKWQTHPFPIRLESNSSHLSSITIHRFPFFQILDDNLCETAGGVVWVWSDKLVSSFEDQGPVIFLAPKKTAGPPTWNDSLFTTEGQDCLPLSSSKVYDTNSVHQECSFSGIVDHLGRNQPNEQSGRNYK